MKKFKVFKLVGKPEFVEAERVEVKIPLLGKSKVAKFFNGKKLVKTIKDFTVLIEVNPEIVETENQMDDDDN